MKSQEQISQEVRELIALHYGINPANVTDDYRLPAGIMGLEARLGVYFRQRGGIILCEGMEVRDLVDQLNRLVGH